MKFKVEMYEEGFQKAHPSTQTYLNRLFKETFHSLEEIESELEDNGPPFSLPDFDKFLSGNPLIGRISYLELKNELEKLSQPIHKMIEEHNSRPWPEKIYVEHETKVEVTKLPHLITELPVMEQKPSITGTGFNTIKVAKIVVSGY